MEGNDYQVPERAQTSVRVVLRAGLLAVGLAFWFGSEGLAGSNVVLAQTRFEGSVAQGLAFAEEACASCHAVGTTDESPLSQAPAFRDLGKRYPIEALAESLAEGIVTAHTDMPEVELSPEEIEDFLSYLDSIQAP